MEEAFFMIVGRGERDEDRRSLLSSCLKSMLIVECLDQK